MKRTTLAALTVAALTTMLSGGTTPASVVGPLDFETGTQAANQFTANFVQLYAKNSGTITQTDPADLDEPNNDYLRLGQSGQDIAVVTAINTTSTNKTLSNSDRFSGPFTLNFSLAVSSAVAGSSFAIYLFDPSTTNGADSLLVSVAFNKSGDTDRVHFYSDATPNAGKLGTAYDGPDITGSNGHLVGGDGASDTYYAVNAITGSDEASGTWTAASLAYTPGSNNDTKLTLTLGTIPITWTIPDALRVSDPAIAFRPDVYGTGSASWRIDNIEVVPEPASAGLFLGAGFATLLRRRRRR